jgi:hypothetical protein
MLDFTPLTKGGVLSTPAEIYVCVGLPEFNGGPHEIWITVNVVGRTTTPDGRKEPVAQPMSGPVRDQLKPPSKQLHPEC